MKHIITFLVLSTLSVCAEQNSYVVTSRVSDGNRAYKTYEEFISGEHVQNKGSLLNRYRDWVTLNYGNDYVKVGISLKFWDKVHKQFPGANAPIVEVYRGSKLIHSIELKEVMWATDVWGDYYKGTCYVYIRGKLRLRQASGIYSYTLDTKTGDLNFQTITFTKEEIEKERKVMDRRATPNKNKANKSKHPTVNRSQSE